MEIKKLDNGTSYGVFSEEEQLRIDSSPAAGLISSAMAQQIAMSRKDVSLFGNELLDAIKKAQKEDLSLASIKVGERRDTIDRNGKPFALTNFRVRLIAHLSHFITRQMKAEDISIYIDAMKKGKSPNLQIVRPIVIKEFAKDVYHGRARRENIAHLVRELYELCTTKQVQSYEIGADGKKKVYSASLLRLVGIGGTSTKAIPSQTEEELAEIDFVEVAFSKLFFYDLNNRYAHLPKQLLDLRGEKGNGTETELFAVLLMSLLSLYWKAYSSAGARGSKAKKDAAVEGKKGEDKKDAISTARKRALSRSVSVGDINDMLTNPYKPNKRSRLFVDIKRAFEIFKLIDLVDAYSIDRKSNIINYTFSLTYGKEREAEALLAIS